MPCCERKASLASFIWALIKLAPVLILLYYILPHTAFGEMWREIIALFR